MKITRALVLLILMLTICSHVNSQGQTCPTTPLNKQARGAVKHKKPPEGNAVSNIDLADMFDWEVPADIESKKVRNSKKPIDPLETEAFKLTGDLWRVKFEMNDCDLHFGTDEARRKRE